MIQKIKRIFEVLKRSKSKDTLNTIIPCDVLLFCGDSNRGVSLNNKAYSPLIDSIKDDMEARGLTCITIAHPWSIITGQKGYGNPISMNRSYLIAKILTAAFTKLNLRFDLKLYEQIIKSSNPKMIISINCSSALCEASRNLDVFHAELLHGIGYTPLPWNWDKKSKQHLPQCILSLDEVSTKTFSILEKKGVMIKEIPHPFLRRFQNGYAKEIPVGWLPIDKKIHYNKEILISLQWGYADGLDAKDVFEGELANGLFYNELEEVIKRTRDTVYWHFRFHPVHYRQPEKYKKHFDFIERFVNKYKNCEWKESTSIPLPSLLTHCSGHITMLSMVSYEAAYVGVKTLALEPELKDGGVYEKMFDDLVTKGYLKKSIVSLEGVLDWVNKVEKTAPLLGNLNVKDDAVDFLLSLANQT